MSDAAARELSQSARLEEAKNIALGWRIVGQIEPQDLEEAKAMLRASAEHAARLCDLLYDEIHARG
ncbi:hypothetical protein [Pantoea sp. 1.19]|uniref:hypothetical protein n=1 Tax=Pantoea sp. 1.19 TaxID=1925589 RepID=UPI000948F9AA|nr:hypothetical protein [Pantoea sp. 1.19]